MQDRANPIKILSAGGIIQALGIIMTAFFLISNPIPAYFSYGILHGFGQGLVYTVILSTAQKWFPNKKGMASGVVVTANGLCGLVLAPVSRSLLDGSGPGMALLAVGGLMTLAWLLSIIFVKVPDESELPEAARENTAVQLVQQQYTAKEMLHTDKFFLLVATMAFSLIAYFLVSPISQSLQTERGVSANTAVIAVMIGSILNALARLILPAMADKIGRISCIRIVTIVSVAAMVSLTISSSYGTTIGVILMYGCYGGIMGNFPSFTSTIFGMKHSGENYGYVMSGVIVGVVAAPLISSLLANAEKGEKLLFIVGACCSVLAFITLMILDRRLKIICKLKGAKKCL